MHLISDDEPAVLQHFPCRGRKPGSSLPALYIKQQLPQARGPECRQPHHRPPLIPCPGTPRWWLPDLFWRRARGCGPQVASPPGPVHPPEGKLPLAFMLCLPKASSPSPSGVPSRPVHLLPKSLARSLPILKNNYGRSAVRSIAAETPAVQA